MIESGYILGGLWIFALGATVGSFANVCIYRIPFQKSLIWPGSHCPKCYSAIRARDNVPILGWLILRGRCRSCGLPIPMRYPLIELLSGALFVLVYFTNIVNGGLEAKDLGRTGFQLLLIAFLIVATFIDYDYRIIPDAITISGMIAGLGLGTWMPWVRPIPSEAATAWEGFRVGFTGLLVGGGMIWAIRILGRILFRKEAMGFGDVTLMAMIGSFLGWEIVSIGVFLAAFLGLVEPLVKTVRMVWILVVYGKYRPVDNEIPFGPYLSMACALLMFGWPWLWKSYLASFFKQLGGDMKFLGELLGF